MSLIYRDYDEFLSYIKTTGRTVLAVSSSMLPRLDGGRFLESLSGIADLTVFSDYDPNPDISSVDKGIEIASRIKPGLILAAGGGSAIDVAKAVRDRYEGECALAVIPTTAGSGSEATKIAVIYKDGVKLSLGSPRMEASAIMFDPKVLITLPSYQKRSTLSDSLCHAIESMWSLRANEQSIEYADSALKGIFAYYKAYLAGDLEAAAKVQGASYDAGRAIDITMTTGGHAMAYKLTTMKGTAHGHACLLAVKQLWDYMDEMGTDLGQVQRYRKDFDEFYGYVDLKAPDITTEDIDILSMSVNKERLANNPLMLDTEELKLLYIRMAEERT